MLENVLEFFKNLPAKICTVLRERNGKDSMNATAINATIAIFYKNVKQPLR